LELFAPCFALAIENARLRSAASGMPPNVEDHSPADQGNAGPLEVGAVARIAHDLKNSMTSVSTFMQLLPKKWGDTVFRSSFYPVDRDEALRVNHLVNDLLDHGKDRFAQRAPVDMRAVLAHILPLKAPLADQRRLRVRVRDGATLSTIRIDRRAIEEAVVNLLSNAMEASPDGGAIDIRLEDDLLPSGQPGIRLEIQDCGPGVDQALREAIFAPYMSTKTDDLSAGGTGLGLAIARQHIEAHGGTIAVENPAEGGALFRIRLPLERRRANRQAH
jgi:signal transduction histidine kinase